MEGKMEVLWSIAGFIIGWTGTDFLGGFAKLTIPITFNLGLGFVGALTGYQLAL